MNSGKSKFLFSAIGAILRVQKIKESYKTTLTDCNYVNIKHL